MSRTKEIPLQSIRVDEYYINNLANYSSFDDQEQLIDDMDELKKRRHLRAMQSKNFIERAAMKVVELVHRLAS